LYNLLWGIFGIQVIIACIYLLLAVEKIKIYVKDRGDEAQLNIKTFRTHAACFSIQMVAGSLYYSFYECKILFGLSALYYGLAFMVACWLNFTSQLILCYIILQLIASSKASKERNESSHIETVRVTEFDESAEI